MEKEFVPFELAVKLKELGFNENCLAYFKDDEFKIPNPHEPFRNSEMKAWFVSAPLWQQAFDWFRTKHGLYYTILPLGYNVNAIQVGVLGELLPYGNNYNYEEARQACLEKLIELCKK